jgi:hypothetical protein
VCGGGIDHSDIRLTGAPQSSGDADAGAPASDDDDPLAL